MKKMKEPYMSCNDVTPTAQQNLEVEMKLQLTEIRNALFGNRCKK